MKTAEEKLKSYEPLWENWTYSGVFLGEGAMSSVFEIQSTAMGMREVAALKLITVKKDFRGEVKIPKTALNEIRILHDLSGCPNIVQYHDSTQRQIYDENNQLSEIDILIKMEKLKPLSEGNTLSESEIIKLGKDICTALSYAAERKIIHRDIKPQNIFVDDDGTYKLGDFGIAKIVSDYSSGYTLNIGTLAYTAPEIQNGATDIYDISSDIYSLGLVLYVFLNNGYMPFVHSSSTLNEAIAKRISGAAFPSPANGSKNLKTIVMRACAHDVKKRYKTPDEMLQDLELLSTGGKKLVVDPFATLDANIDVIEDFTATSKETLKIPDRHVDVFKTYAKTPPISAEPEKKFVTGSGLKIKMNTTMPKSTESMMSKPSGSAESESKGKLKISSGLKTTIPSESKPSSTEKPKMPEPEKDKKKSSSFFTNSPSL